LLLLGAAIGAGLSLAFAWVMSGSDGESGSGQDADNKDR
jgi:hypothetical protein